MGVAGAGRRQRLEAEALQIARAADIPRIGNDEAAGLVQFAKRLALVGGGRTGGRHGTLPAMRRRQACHGARVPRQRISVMDAMSRRDDRTRGRRNAEDCVDLDALEQNAQRVMRPELWVFCDTGADDEITAKENVTAWRKLKLRPRVLRDIVEIDTSVSLLGARVKRRSWWRRPAGITCSMPRASARRRAARRRRCALRHVHQRRDPGRGRRQGARQRRRNGSSSTCSPTARRPARCSTAASRRASRRWC